MGANRGVINISEKEVEKFKAIFGYKINGRILDVEDGLPESLQEPTDSNVIEGTDGLIWFATNQGLVWVDPNRIPVNADPPPVSIESLSSNEIRYDLSSSVRLPARTTSLQIHYAALSLSMPERVRFHYKLDGVDQSWQNVDTRRDAYYTNLAPGMYTLHVIACNWSARLEMCQWRRETLDKESIWDEARSTSLSRW